MPVQALCRWEAGRGGTRWPPATLPSVILIKSSPPNPSSTPCRYWFLTEAYPLATGRVVVRTPQWLSRLCLQYNIGHVPIQVRCVMYCCVLLMFCCRLLATAPLVQCSAS